MGIIVIHILSSYDSDKTFLSLRSLSEAIIHANPLVRALKCRDVVNALWDSALEVAQIGDCIKASTITAAIYQGHHAAMDL